MSCALSLHFCFLRTPVKHQENVKQLNVCSIALLALVPSIFNFIGVAINFYAMLFLPASIVSILHAGAELLSVAVIRRLFLNIQLQSGQWMAVLIVTCGLMVVAVSHIVSVQIKFRASSTIGIILMLLRTAVGSLKTTVEEILFQRYRAPVYLVTGFEGIASFTLAISFWILKEPSGPGKMMSRLHDVTLLLTFIAFIAVVGTTEMLAGLVTANSSALTFCIFKSFRPFVLWGLSLFLHYCISNSQGEGWKLASWWQLAGFVLVAVGIWSYQISVQIECESLLFQASNELFDDDSFEHSVKYNSPTRFQSVNTDEMSHEFSFDDDSPVNLMTAPPKTNQQSLNSSVDEIRPSFVDVTLVQWKNKTLG